jgi:outer membrane immunogenic protein
MRKVSAFAGVALLLAGSAFAADLPIKAPVYKAPPPAPVFSWTGWYIGGNAGYGWGANTSNTIANTDPSNTGLTQYLAASGPAFPNLKPQGFIGGAQVGYDWQVSNYVFGVVTDFQGTDITASGSGTVSPPGFVTSTQSLSEKLEYLGTVRARAGYAVDNWLFYGTGGLAYGQVNSALNFAAPAAFGGQGSFFSGTTSDTRIGWTAGAGINYAVTRNWIVGAEYLHYDLGHTTVTGVQVFPGFISPATISASQAVAGDIVRGTINYKF